MTVQLLRRRERQAGRGRSRRWRLAALATAVVAVFLAATAALLVWPPQGMPARVDAIFLLGGEGDRLPYGLALARERHAPVLVVSTSTPIATGSDKCVPRIPGVRVICFNPDPQSTQGEAEFAARLDRRYHWKTVAIVAIAPQNIRVRIRFARCINARIYVVNAPFASIDWPYQLAYQWGALFKAVLLQRSC